MLLANDGLDNGDFDAPKYTPIRVEQGRRFDHKRTSDTSLYKGEAVT